MDRLPDDVWSEQGLDGKYLFERQIAASAMAVVVIARHLELDERVAIKFLSPEALRSNAAVSRFRREAKAAAKIKNQHVVRIIDVATTAAGIPYIVMEFLDGKDLERLLAQYPHHQAPIADAVDFILQASEALVEGHSLGIVHRDLKPANLFCVDRGDGFPMIKVLDFGISKFVASIGEVERTDRHEILGSPRYMSPEQIESACNVDHRTDIWSLGVILYEAIAGCVPFNGDLIPELWRKIRHEAPETLPRIRRDCPAELWEVVARCLQKDPLHRYADLGELAHALAPLAPERSRASIARIRWTADVNIQTTTRPSTFSDSYDRVSTNPHRNRYRWVVAGGIASTVGIGLSLTTIRRGLEPGDSPPPISARQPDIEMTELSPASTTQRQVDTVAIPIERVSMDTSTPSSSAGTQTPAVSSTARSTGPLQRDRRTRGSIATPPEPSPPPAMASTMPSGIPEDPTKTDESDWLMPPETEWK